MEEGRFESFYVNLDRDAIRFLSQAGSPIPEALFRTLFART